MNGITAKLAALALLSASMLVLASCTKNGDANMKGDETVAEVDTPSGAMVVDTKKISATVTAVDPATRKVTLQSADGTTKTIKCGPEVVNFPQIEVGDVVTITHTEELAVFLGAGEPPRAAAASGISLAPVGSKPGGVVTNVVQLTAKVTAIDPATRHVTLELPDGTTKTVKAGTRVDLNTVKTGDNVTVQYAEALAITVEAP